MELRFDDVEEIVAMKRIITFLQLPQLNDRCSRGAGVWRTGWGWGLGKRIINEVGVMITRNSPGDGEGLVHYPVYFISMLFAMGTWQFYIWPSRDWFLVHHIQSIHMTW